MKKKFYRYFGGFLTAQEKWLNKMAQKGYKLVRTGKLFYEFETCESGKYQYCVDFIAEKSQQKAENYKQFLEGCGYTVFYKNAALGFSIGRVRFRPWASGSGKISTDSTTFYKELLIVEKENDGRPFELHTTTADKIRYYKKWRNIWLTYFAMFALMDLLFIRIAPIASIVLGSIGLLASIPLIAYQAKIIKSKKQLEFEE